MNLLIRFVIFALTSWTMSAATAGSMLGKTALFIDGVVGGMVYQVEGGEPYAAVVVEAASGSALPKKHLGSLAYEPITLVVPFPLSAPIVECIKDLCRKRSARKTLVLAQYDLNGNLVGRPMEATNALLTEVLFPAFDAAGKDPERVTLIFTPESTKPSTTSPATLKGLSAQQGNLSTSAFKVSIAGLPTARISRIEPITIKLATATAPPEFSNLTLTVNSQDEAAWNTWHDSFLVNRANDDASEKTGTLELLSHNLSEVVFAFQFSHLGLVRKKTIALPTGVEGLARFQAELYYETLTLSAPVRPLTAVTVVAPAIVTGTVLPAASPVAPTTGVASAPVTRTAVVSNPADQGGRDPKDFPRLDGTVRKTYSAIQQKISLQEMAVYSARESLDGLEQSYMKILEAAGWEFNSRVENNDAVGRMHQIIVNWKNGPRSVAITFTEVKAGGSEIGVNLTTRM